MNLISELLEKIERHLKSDKDDRLFLEHLAAILRDKVKTIEEETKDD